MWARRNEDQIPPSSCNYNLIHLVEDISEESGSAGEPVTLSEVKDYLRLEGFGGDSSSGLAMQAPLSFSFTTGSSVQSALLQVADVAIVSVVREGTGYSPENPLTSNRGFLFNGAAGTITFLNSSSGAETVDASYGIQGAAGTVDDFDFDDDLISSLINEGRMFVEKLTGIHLVNKRLHVVASNGAGMIELPGPVTGTITGLDEDGNALGPDYRTIGTLFPQVKSPNLPMMDFTYWAGYNGNAPEWAKNAIKAYVADHYEYRGDDAPPAANVRTAQKCKAHGRLSKWG